jgi:predicted AAA+ superfamily ATPase
MGSQTESHRISRILNLPALLEKKSYFLLGPRQTGKSFMIRQQLKGHKSYNLLLKDTFQKLSFNPSWIRQQLRPEDKIIVIDEIQKIPALLDEVQYLIEEKGIRFLLTGSSARKLKRYGTNLLGGRARVLCFHPFVRGELKENFDLDRALNVGLLPSVYFSDEPDLDLDAYLGLYLQQEIANEGLTRNLPAFSRFLEVAALCHGEQIDFTGIANDAQVPRTTVHEYFQVLKDTLIAWELPSWKPGKAATKRKPVATSKFYFFDYGVVKRLQKIGDIKPGSPLYGKAFESYMAHEIKSYCDYHHIQDLHYWRTTTQEEVDFIINQRIAIEIKGKSHLGPRDFKGLRWIEAEGSIQKRILVYLGEDQVIDQTSGVEILNWTTFLDRLWSGEFVKKRP